MNGLGRGVCVKIFMSQHEGMPPQIEHRRQNMSHSRHFREVTYAISYLHGMDPPVVHRDLNLGTGTVDSWEPKGPSPPNATFTPKK